MASDKLRFAAPQTAADYVEVVEQRLEDAKCHEARAAAYRSSLTAFLGSDLADRVLSPDAFPEFRRLAELSVERGFETFDGEQLARSLLKEQAELHSVHLENIQLQRDLASVRDCIQRTAALQTQVTSALDQDGKRRATLAAKADSNRRQIAKDTAEAKKFQEAADTIMSELQSTGYSDTLSHAALTQRHLANRHLAAERQALAVALSKYGGLSPDPAAAALQVAELEKRVARLEAEIQEQGKFLL